MDLSTKEMYGQLPQTEAKYGKTRKWCLVDWENEVIQEQEEYDEEGGCYQEEDEATLIVLS